MEIDMANLEDITIIDAAYDYKYLLSRGYNQRLALDVVTLRYSLNKEKRLLLYRCIHSMQYATNIVSKIVYNLTVNDVIVIDFYNTLLTILCALENCNVYLCDDCVARDLRGSKLKSQDDTYILKAYELILNTLSKLKPSKIIIIADKNFSHSAIHVNQFNKYIEERGLISHSILSLTPDKDSIEISKKEEAIVISSDSVILERAYKVFPLTSIIINKLGIPFAINFAKLFGTLCNYCYENSI
jgi:hypothetical protein